VVFPNASSTRARDEGDEAAWFSPLLRSRLTCAGSFLERVNQWSLAVLRAFPVSACVRPIPAVDKVTAVPAVEGIVAICSIEGVIS
jgi:hypothetical protein